MNVADYIVAVLGSLGVRHVFGYPGSPLVPLLAALERQDSVRWVLMRHENAAALAAGAHARLTGGLGVCVATSGPGALNALGGVVDADLDRIDDYASRLTVRGRTHRLITATHGPVHLVEVDGVTHRVSRDEGGVLRSPAPALVVATPVAVGEEVAAGAPDSLSSPSPPSSVSTPLPP